MEPDELMNKVVKILSKRNATTEQIAKAASLCEYDVTSALFELEELGKIVRIKLEGYIYPHCNQPRVDVVFGITSTFRRELAHRGII